MKKNTNNYGLLFVVILLILFTIATCDVPEVQAQSSRPVCSYVDYVQPLHNGMYAAVGCPEQAIVVSVASGVMPDLGDARIVTVYRGKIFWYELHQGPRSNPRRWSLVNW